MGPGRRQEESAVAPWLPVKAVVVVSRLSGRAHVWTAVFVGFDAGFGHEENLPRRLFMSPSSFSKDTYETLLLPPKQNQTEQQKNIRTSCLFHNVLAHTGRALPIPMGTEDGARAESLLWRLFGRGGRIGGGYQQQQLPLRQQLRGGRLRGGGWLQPLAFLAAGVFIGFYGGAVLQLGPHHGSSR